MTGIALVLIAAIFLAASHVNRIHPHHDPQRNPWRYRLTEISANTVLAIGAGACLLVGLWATGVLAVL